MDINSAMDRIRAVANRVLPKGWFQATLVFHPKGEGPLTVACNFEVEILPSVFREAANHLEAEMRHKPPTSKVSADERDLIVKIAEVVKPVLPPELSFVAILYNEESGSIKYTTNIIIRRDLQSVLSDMQKTIANLSDEDSTIFKVV
jgi:hypothetical protein